MDSQYREAKGGSSSYLVDEGEAKAESIGNGGSTLRASGVRADDDRIFVSRNRSFNVPLNQRLTVEVIHRNVKETLVSDGRKSAPLTERTQDRQAAFGKAEDTVRHGCETQGTRHLSGACVAKKTTICTRNDTY